MSLKTLALLGACIATAMPGCTRPNLFQKSELGDRKPANLRTLTQEVTGEAYNVGVFPLMATKAKERIAIDGVPVPRATGWKILPGQHTVSVEPHLAYGGVHSGSLRQPRSPWDTPSGVPPGNLIVIWIDKSTRIKDKRIADGRAVDLVPGRQRPIEVQFTAEEGHDYLLYTSWSDSCGTTANGERGCLCYIASIYDRTIWKYVATSLEIRVAQEICAIETRSDSLLVPENPNVYSFWRQEFKSWVLARPDVWSFIYARRRVE